MISHILAGRIEGDLIADVGKMRKQDGIDEAPPDSFLGLLRSCDTLKYGNRPWDYSKHRLNDRSDLI